MNRQWRRRTGLLVIACAVVALSAPWALAAPSAAGAGPKTGAGVARYRGPLEVDDVRPLDPSPGTSVQITYLAPDGALPTFTIAGREASVLHSEAGSAVVRVPPDTPLGLAKLTVGEGEHAQRLLLRVEPVQRRKLLRNILGGLALFLLGLRSIGQGLRRSVGPRDRGLLAGATRSPARALGFGALMGGLSQSTTSAAAIFIGMRQAHMVGPGASAWLIVGAYFGTLLTASLLPLAATREALIVIAVGTPLLMFSRRRRARGIGAAIVGFGMLALGLRFLQSGFQPLIGDPELVVYTKLLTGHGMLGGFASAAVGAVLAAILQGPGPVFALVLGVAQSSGVVGLHTGLSVLAGAAIGSSLGVAILALPYGEVARRLRVGFFWFGVAALLLQVLALPLWAAAADALVAGDPAELAHGKKVLLPHMATHLAVGFVLAQLAALAVFALAAAVWARFSPPAQQGTAGAAPQARAPEGGASAPLGDDLAALIDSCARAVECTLEMARTHGATPRSQADDAVQDAEQQLDALTTRLAVGAAEREAAPAAHDHRIASLAVAHLQRSITALRDTGERAIADNLHLLPEIDEAATEMAKLLFEGMAAAAAALRGAPPEGLEAVQGREIRINALESAIRTRVLSRPRTDTAEVFVGSQLLSGLENVGNHLFRASSALAAAPDELL